MRLGRQRRMGNEASEVCHVRFSLFVDGKRFVGQTQGFMDNYRALLMEPWVAGKSADGALVDMKNPMPRGHGISCCGVCGCGGLPLWVRTGSR